MSGGFSVPFAIAATFAPEGYQRLICFIVAYASLAVCAYSMWTTEYKKVKRYEERLRPKLRCEFDPNDAGCVRHVTSMNLLYFRIKVSADNMAMINGCRATLTRILRDGAVAMDGENIPLPFAHELSAKQVKDGVPEFVDLIAVSATNRVAIASKDFVVPSSIQPDTLFARLGKYTFRVVITCDNGPPITIEPILNWTGDSATSSVLATA